MTSTATLLQSNVCTIQCRECGADFVLQWPALATLVRVCPECSEGHALEDQRRAVLSSKNLRGVRWKHICPAEFLATEPYRLPHPHKLQRLLAWQYGTKGVMLHGPTGGGKSRCAWLLLKREFEAGRTVAALDCSAGLTYAAKYSASAEAVERWVSRLSSVELLLLDDAWKAKLTDSFEGALFTVINRRTEARLPLVVTCNDTGESLRARMSQDRGDALVRRLREFCQDFPFPN